MSKILLGVSNCILDRAADGYRCAHGIVVNEVSRKFFEWLSFSADEERSLISRQNSSIIDSASEKIKRVCGYIIDRALRDASKINNSHEGLDFETLKIMHRFPMVPIEETVRMQDPCLRDNFFKRVYVVHRWQTMVNEGLSAHALMDFHARHKLIIMSHGDYRELGHLLAGLTKENLAQQADQYFLQLMGMLLTLPTRANHVNVLQHIQGHLKKDISREDKAELGQLIDSYRNYEVPLIAPLTLLKHHFRKSPDPYIQGSHYFSPYPGELGTVHP